MASVNARTDRFLALYSECQRRLYAYIRAQVRSVSDADDVLQETCAVLWRKFDEFDPESDFGRWACRVARLEILTHFRKTRQAAPLFSEAAADDMAEILLDLSETIDERHRALSDCVDSLPRRDRRLIAQRYQSNKGVEELAASQGRSASYVYKWLARVHDVLFQCVEEKLRGDAKEGAP